MGGGGWPRRFGRVLLAGSEVVLAFSGLVTIWMLTDISRGVERGVYEQEVASGFAVAFLGLWILSFLVLGLVLVIDAAHRVVRTVDDGGFDPVRERVPHTALELALAALIAVVSLGIDLSSEPFDAILAATATLGIWVLLHHTRTLGRFARRTVSRS